MELHKITGCSTDHPIQLDLIPQYTWNWSELFYGILLYNDL